MSTVTRRLTVRERSSRWWQDANPIVPILFWAAVGAGVWLIIIWRVFR